MPKESLTNCEFLDKTVAYKGPDDSDVAYGLVVNVEGKHVRIIDYSRVLDISDAVSQTEQRIGAEESVISSMKLKLAKLRVQQDECKSGKKTTVLEKTLLQYAKKRLSTVDQQELVRICGLDTLGESARLVCSAVASIMRNSTTVMAWSTVKRALSEPGLINSLMKLDEGPMSEELYVSVLERYLGSRLFTYALAAKESTVVAALHKWVTAFIDFQRAQYVGNHDMELRQQVDACKNVVLKAELRRDGLQQNLKEIKEGDLYTRTGQSRTVPAEHLLFLAKDTGLSRNLFIIRPISNSHMNGLHKICDPCDAEAPSSSSSFSASVMGDNVAVDTAKNKSTTTWLASAASTATPPPTHAHLQQKASSTRFPTELSERNPDLHGSTERENYSSIKQLERANERLRSENKLLSGAMESAVREKQVFDSLSTVKGAFDDADVSISETVDDYLKLQNRHDVLMTQAHSLLQYAMDREEEVEALRQQVTLSRRELLLCKAVIAVLRAKPNIPAEPIHEQKRSAESENNAGATQYLVGMLEDASEYVRGVEASLIASNTFDPEE